MTMFFARDFKNTNIGSWKSRRSLPLPEASLTSDSDTVVPSSAGQFPITVEIPTLLPIDQYCSYDPDRPWLFWPMCYPIDAPLTTEILVVIVGYDSDDDSTGEEYSFVYNPEPTYTQRASDRYQSFSDLDQDSRLNVWVLLALGIAFAFALVAYSFYKKWERALSMLARLKQKPAAKDTVRQLEAEVARLESVNERIEKRNAKLEGEDKTQFHEIQKLQAEHRKCKETQDDLSAEMTKLNGDIEALTKDHAAEQKDLTAQIMKQTEKCMAEKNELLRRFGTEKRDLKAQLEADAREFYRENLKQQLEKFSSSYRLDKVNLAAAHITKLAAVQAELKHFQEKLKDCEDGRSKGDDAAQAQLVKDLQKQLNDNEQAAIEEQAKADQDTEVVQWLEMFRRSVRRSWLECQGINTLKREPIDEDFDEKETDAFIASLLPSEVRDQVAIANDRLLGQDGRDLTVMEEKVREMEEQLRGRETEIHEKDKQLQTKEGEVNGLSQEVERLENGIEGLKDLIWSKNDLIDRYEEQLGAPNEGFKLDDSEEEKEYDNTKKATKTSDNQTVTSAVKTEEQEIKTLRQKLTIAEMDLQAEKNRLFGLTWQADLDKDTITKLQKAEKVYGSQLKKAEAVHGRQFQRMFNQVTDAGTLLSTALYVRARTEQLLKTSLSNEDKLSRLGRVKFLADGTVTLSDPTGNLNDQQPHTLPPRTDRKGTFGICDHCRKFRLPCDRKLDCETCKDNGRPCTRNDSAVGSDSRVRKAVSEDCDLCRATYKFDHNGTEGIEEVQPAPIICDGEARCSACTQKGQACKRLGHNVGAENGPSQPQIQRQPGWGNLRAVEKTVYTKSTDAGMSVPQTPVQSGSTSLNSQESAVPKTITLKLDLSESSLSIREYEKDGQDDQTYEEQGQDGGNETEQAEDKKKLPPATFTQPDQAEEIRDPLLNSVNSSPVEPSLMSSPDDDVASSPPQPESVLSSDPTTLTSSAPPPTPATLPTEGGKTTADAQEPAKSPILKA